MLRRLFKTNLSYWIPVIALGALFQNCIYEENKVISQSGTVIFLNLEGGFYGIMGDDGVNYDPVNLGKEYHSDGMRINFQGKLRDDLAGIHQWGQIIELTYIVHESDPRPPEDDPY